MGGGKFFQPQKRLTQRTRVQKTEQHQAGAAFPGDRAGSTFANVRAGFTLVEVIVVLVIVAILAAIAVPALTGYIEKARDKAYIAQARNNWEGARVVFAESYADGTFGAKAAAPGYIASAVNTDGARCPNLRYSGVGNLSVYAYGSTTPATLYLKISELTGKPFHYNYPDYWELWLTSDVDGKPSPLKATGFFMLIYPKGYDARKPILVTYKLTRASGLTDFDSFTAAMGAGSVAYDDTAGYEVYHLSYG
jgi:prepilin-type N-terminal cleavage/methylation domain-containing protein